jgi:DNA-binding GntR family transcriptional regulator
MVQSIISAQPEPLYEKVYRLIKLRIVSGEWKPQSLLPGEIILAQELGVSVGTIRKAMDQLVRENFIVRERGRGTFVRKDEVWRQDSGFTLLDRKQQPVTPEVVVEGAKIVEPAPYEKRLVRAPFLIAVKPRVLRLERTWLVAGAPVGSEISAIDLKRFPDLSSCVPNAALLSIELEEAVRARTDRVNWQVQASAPRSVAPALGKLAPKQSSSRVILEKLSLDNRGAAIEVRRYEFELGGVLSQLVTAFSAQ